MNEQFNKREILAVVIRPMPLLVGPIIDEMQTLSTYCLSAC